MRRPSRISALSIAILLAIVARNLPAQGRGSLSGRVIERLGRPVSQANVLVEHADSAVGTVRTDASGSWAVTELIPGTYRVTIRRLGYRALRVDAQVQADKITTLLSLLDPAPLTLDTLIVQTVAGAAPTADAGTALHAAEITLLPTTVDIRQLVALTPGARPNQIWGGASDQANAYTLDGTTVTHTGIGGAWLLPSPSWIETLAVRGLGAGADVGGVQGGAVEMTTLNGRNVLEGSLRTSFESHQLNGSNLIPGEIGHELDQRWEVDGQLRGPIVPDRLHFALFGNRVAQRDIVPNFLDTRSGVDVPDPPSLDDSRWLAKTTWKPGVRDLVQGSLMGRHVAGEHTGQTGYEDTDATTRARAWGLSGNLTWQRSWSAATGLTIRVGGFTGRDRHEPYAGATLPAIEILRTTNPPQYQNAPFRTLGAPSSQQLSAVLSRNMRLAGVAHELQLGGEFVLGSWYFSSQRTTAMTWRPLAVLGFDPHTPATWVYSNAIPTAWGGDVRLDSRTTTGALFVQDHAAIAHWLSLSPGIRFGSWSGTLISPAGRHIRVLHDHGLEGRLGMTVDLDRARGLVATVHWGRYHQPAFAGLFDRAIGAAVYQDEEIWSYLGAPPSAPTTTFTVAQRDSLAAAGLFRLDQINRLADAGRVEQLRQPYMDQTVASLERDLGTRWKAAAVYVHRRNRHMIALVDRNIANNYTVVDNVIVRDRFGQPVYFRGQPLVLEHLAISNADILYVQDLLRQGQILTGTQLLAPPGLSPTELAALRYEPDLVLTNVPEATRRFDQLQLRLDARYPLWWAGGSASFTRLEGNMNVVSGPDDYTTGGPGPWVRLNEHFGFYGPLSNQGQFEAKLFIGAVLPAGLRGGAFFSFATGDRVAPTMLISGLLTDYAVPVPNASDPSRTDTVSFTPFLFRSTAGHRIFVLPRGIYQYDSHSSLDLHLERTFPRGRSELAVVVDAFNVLGARSVLATQTVVNSLGGFASSDYGRVLGRLPPRTLRFSATLRF